MVDSDELPANYVPYVPVSKRRAAMMAQLGAGAGPSKRTRKVRTAEDEAELQRAMERELESEKEREEREREVARKGRTLLQESQEVKRLKEIQGVFLGVRGWPSVRILWRRCCHYGYFDLEGSHAQVTCSHALLDLTLKSHASSHLLNAALTRRPKQDSSRQRSGGRSSNAG
jgi:hypothetical protein